MSSDWPVFKDEDGTLVPIEFSKLPFEPKRIFYVCDVPKDEERGMHAHYNTQQVLTCVRGKILIKLHNGISISETVLQENDTIFIEKMIWDSQVFLTGDDVLLSICSTAYSTEDYISDFDLFLKLSKEQ